MSIAKAGWLVIVVAGCGSKDPAPVRTTPISNQVSTSEPAELVAFRTEMCGCTRLTCHQEIHDRYTVWAQQHARGAQIEDRAYRECRAKVLHDFGLSVDLPEECLGYGAAMEKLFTCDQLPPQTLDALKSSFKQTVEAWTATPPEDRAQLAMICSSATEDVNRSAAACK
jgi:hypothetical protein